MNVNEVAAVNYVPAHPQRSAYIDVVLVGGGTHTFVTTMTETEWNEKAEAMVGMNGKP
ncbi:MAG TPA: hypothetical protein VH253_06675 [Phycisphaerae bacterium]|nr:hypothetical protein [Phycisphaerae bacterium]